MTDDPAVRSVRVAVALCDRFAELLKGPSTVKAHKQSGAMFGVSGDDEGLSLRIGEVQQIYPEIWRHLDDARTAFAARGIDVAAYDQIRAAEGTALGAAVDMTYTREGYGNHAIERTEKSANFNREGHARAVKAYNALMVATPQIAWAAIAKAEDEDPNIKAFTRSTTTKRWMMIGLLGVVIASPFIYVWNARRQERNKIASYRAPQGKPELSADQRATLEKAIADGKAQVEAARKAWTAAFEPGALAAIKPSVNPCAYKLAAPAPKAAEQFVKYGNGDGLGDEFYSYKAGDAVRDDQLVKAGMRIDSYANRLRDGYATPDDAAQLRKQLPAHVLVFVIDREKEPAAGSGTSYTPGEVTGHAYVFSSAQQKIVCAAGVDVKNAPDEQTSPKDDEANQLLFRDLEVKIRQAIAAGLHAI